MEKTNWMNIVSPKTSIKPKFSAIMSQVDVMHAWERVKKIKMLRQVGMEWEGGGGCTFDVEIVDNVGQVEQLRDEHSV